jgi:CubicO group peptidase (beta-lactamase class C family)
MKRFFKILIPIVLVLLVILAAAAFWKREQITRLLAVNSLFSEEKIVNNFSHMNTMFLTRPMSRGTGPVSDLRIGATATLPPAVDGWIEQRHVTALVVLKDGKIVNESYFRGTGPNDLRISWSVAKSFLSALFGIALDQGKIASLDDPVTKYAPALTASAYGGATIRNVLNMSSGVKFNEDYLDFNSDINRMDRTLALGGSMDGFASGLTERENEPGKTWQYVSIDTHVLGMVLRGATGRSIPEMLEEQIIAPLGFRVAPYYVTDGNGVAFVLGGLNMTTRDYARFGQMFINNGMWNGTRIVPADWIAASTIPTAPKVGGDTGYGYQWWIPRGGQPGEYMARGIYGQYIYINQSLGVVIASNAADRKFRDPGVSEQNIAIFREIANSL